MPSKQPKTCAANAIFLDRHMCNLLIAAIEAPDGTGEIAPDLVANLVATYGVELVACYINDPDLDFVGKITDENLSMALVATCDTDIICNALKAKDFNGASVWSTWAGIETSATAGEVKWPTSADGVDQYGEGALKILQQEKLMKQLKLLKVDLSCLTLTDVYEIAGGIGDFEDMEPTSTSTPAQITAMIEVAHDMWILKPALDNVDLMRQVFGAEALYYLYQCPGSLEGDSVCVTGTTVEDVLASHAFGDIDNTFTDNEPKHFNKMNTAPWIKCGTANFNPEIETDKAILLASRRVAFLFCNATKAEVKSAVDCERLKYGASVEHTWTKALYPVSFFLNSVYEYLPADFIKLFSDVVKVTKFSPKHSVLLADIARVYTGLNMCQLIKCIDALAEMEKASSKLVTLGNDTTLLTVADVASSSGSAYPSYEDSDDVILPSHLVAVGNAILLESYFSKSHRCVEDLFVSPATAGKKGGKIDAGSLLNLTYITGVFTSDTASTKTLAPVVAAHDCSAYESPSAFCDVLAKMYTKNIYTFVVASKMTAWVTNSGTSPTDDLFSSLPALDTLVVDATNDDFAGFSKYGYEAHAAKTPQDIICKVSSNSLAALVATVDLVDVSTDATGADTLIGFFNSLAKKFDFCKALDAWFCVMKTQDSNVASGGQKINPVNGTGMAATDAQLQKIVLHVLNCGTKEEICMLFGKKIEITRQVFTGLENESTELANAMMTAVKNKISSAKIIEAFTKDCDSTDDSQARMYAILKKTFGDEGETKEVANEYVLSKIVRSCPVKDIVEYIGVEEPAEDLTNEFGQTLISRFTIEEALACNTVTFDQLVFVVKGYRMDKYGCLEECLNLPWPIADYESVFGEDCLNESTCPDETPEEAVAIAITKFLSGQH